MSQKTRILQHAAAAALLLAVIGCSATPAAKEAPSSHEATSGSSSQQGYGQPGAQAGAQPPFVASSLSLAEEEAAFDLFEKQVGLALDGKSALGEPMSAGEDRCVTVCKALTSMRQSRDHICQLDQGRCTQAKERVERSEKRAREACPACATPT